MCFENHPGLAQLGLLTCPLCFKSSALFIQSILFCCNSGGGGLNGGVTLCLGLTQPLTKASHLALQVCHHLCLGVVRGSFATRGTARAPSTCRATGIGCKARSGLLGGTAGWSDVPSGLWGLPEPGEQSLDELRARRWS